MLFNKKILSLLLLCSAQSMEVSYDANQLHSERVIEKVVISKQTIRNLPLLHIMDIGRLPDNLQVYFEQEGGRASQINFNKKYQHTNALLTEDYRPSYIESEALDDGYRFHVHNHARRHLVPISGSYRTRNGDEFETRYFVLDYFFNDDYTARDNIELPHNGPLIDRDLAFRAANGEPLEIVRYDDARHTFDLINPSEIIHVNLFNIANIENPENPERGRVAVTDFAASTVLFNKCALQNGPMMRQEGNGGRGNTINTISSDHHKTNQRFIDPMVHENKPLLHEKMEEERPVPEILRYEKEALFLFEKIRDKNNILENLKSLESLMSENSEHLSPITAIKCYACLLRNKDDSTIKKEMDDLLSEFADHLSHEEFIDIYTLLVKSKTKDNKDQAENLKNFLFFYQEEISHETCVKGWTAVVSAKLHSNSKDAEELKTLLKNHSETLSGEVRVNGWTAVSFAQLKTQDTDVQVLQDLLNKSKTLLDETKVKGWTAVVSAKLHSNSKDAEELKTLLKNHSETLSDEVRVKGWTAVVSAQLVDTNREDAQVLQALLNDESKTLSDETRVKGWTAVSFAQLKTQHTDAQVLQALLKDESKTLSNETRVKGWTAVVSAQLVDSHKKDAEVLQALLKDHSKTLSDKTRVKGWQAVLNARKKINYEIFTKLKDLIPFAQDKGKFVSAIASNVETQNLDQCEKIINFCSKYQIENSLKFFERIKMKFKKELEREEREERERSRNYRKERARSDKGSHSSSRERLKDNIKLKPFILPNKNNNTTEIEEGEII